MKEKICNLCTDAAPAMLGKTSGFAALLKTKLFKLLLRTAFYRVRNFRQKKIRRRKIGRKKIRRRKIGRTKFSPQLGTNCVSFEFQFNLLLVEFFLSIVLNKFIGRLYPYNGLYSEK